MKDDWIKDEYLHLQELIQTFDQKALTIKAWSATISMAGVGIAYEQAEPSLLLISSVGALLFWLIEWRWKVFQSAHYGRIEEIEASMREAE